MQWQIGIAVGWIETIVVAIRATAKTFCAIAVRTGEAHIERDFLHSVAMHTFGIIRIRVKSPAVAPGK